jgi:lipopolysaccharide export system permease protein
VLQGRTLRRYVAKRFLLAILGAFSVCAVLIFMIDMVELLRMSRRATDLSVTSLLWMGLLRLPAFSEILLSFAVMVGSIGALLSLSRKSELTVMRAGGMSVWQFLRPGIAVALLLGVFSVTAYNPLAAAARDRAERLYSEAFGRESNLLRTGSAGTWLRQDGQDGQSVINAASASNRGLKLRSITAFTYDTEGHFSERIDARQAELKPGYWVLEDALVSGVGREPEEYKTYLLSTYLTPERVSDALGSLISVSFWEMPNLIEVAEKAKLSSERLRIQYEALLSRPLLCVAMVILAATVSLRSFRSGGIQTMVVSGMTGGFSFFLLAEVSRQIGTAGLAPAWAAVWLPIVLVILVTLTVLLYQEDG